MMRNLIRFAKEKRKSRGIVEPELFKSFVSLWYHVFFWVWRLVRMQRRHAYAYARATEPWSHHLAPVSRLTQARGASLVSENGSTTTVTIGEHGICRRLAGPSFSSRLGIESAITAARAGFATRARAVVLVGRTRVPPASSNSNRKPLDDTSLPRSLARIHAVIDGEVAADHVGLRSSSILGQLIRMVFTICRVFAVVHANRAHVAVASTERLEERIWPVTTLA